MSPKNIFLIGILFVYVALGSQVVSATENYCNDPESWKQWDTLIQKYPDDLDIQATANTVSISGERKMASEEEDAKYHRREREAGKFSRMIGLPSDIDANKVEANLKNGILTVVVPKAESAKSRQITVK